MLLLSNDPIFIPNGCNDLVYVHYNHFSWSGQWGRWVTICTSLQLVVCWEEGGVKITTQTQSIKKWKPVIHQCKILNWYQPEVGPFLIMQRRGGYFLFPRKGGTMGKEAVPLKIKREWLPESWPEAANQPSYLFPSWFSSAIVSDHWILKLCTCKWKITRKVFSDKLQCNL